MTIRPLVFPPKDLPLPLPFPLCKNITIPPPPPPPKKKTLQEMFAKYRRSQVLTVPKDTFGKSSCWKCPSDVPSMEPFPRTGGRGTFSPRSSHSYCSIGSFSFSIAKAQLEVVLVVYQRVLELNYFYSFLCLTKIALLFRCLNMQLRRITLAREILGNLRGGCKEFRSLKKTHIINHFGVQHSACRSDLCGILPP